MSIRKEKRQKAPALPKHEVELREEAAQGRYGKPFAQLTPAEKGGDNVLDEGYGSR